ARVRIANGGGEELAARSLSAPTSAETALEDGATGISSSWRLCQNITAMHVRRDDSCLDHEILSLLVIRSALGGQQFAVNLKVTPHRRHGHRGQRTCPHHGRIVGIVARTTRS